MFFIRDNFQLTDTIRFSFELSSSFCHWIACQIARTITSLLVNQKFQLSSFKLLRVDCSNTEMYTMSHADIVYQAFLVKSWHRWFVKCIFSVLNAVKVNRECDKTCF